MAKRPWRASDRVRELDDRVDRWFDRHLRGRPAADRAMYTLSELGDFGLIWLLLGAAQGLVGTERQERKALRLMVLMGAESAIVNGIVKSLFRRSRPVPQFERPHHLRIPLTTSFPSGHASSAFSAASLLADGDRALAPPLYALAVAVAASRVHVRIHHASDVLGGVAVGVVLGAVGRRVWPVPARNAGDGSAG